MKKAIMYGAGNIGRGFIGQQFSEADYDVVFVDIDPIIIKEMNEAHGYPIKIVAEKEIQDIWVDKVSAIDGSDIPDVAKNIAEADIMATAVGVNVLPRIMKPIAEGLRLRWSQNNFEPFNIIICENLMDADKYMRKLLKELLDEPEQILLDQYVGLVEASIGRMVPVMTKERQRGNILSIWVEPYCKLPVDEKAFKGELPNMKNLIPFSPFDFYIEKKLFVHNMGHALTAYLGQLNNYDYIWEAIKDPYIKLIVLKAMQESAIALSKKYKCDIYELLEHVDDLIYRFGNPHLGDTITRVGKDPLRKLSANDRLVGAAQSCITVGVNATYIAFGIASALLFEDSSDIALLKLKNDIKNQGIRLALSKITSIDMNCTLMDTVEYFYIKLNHGEKIERLVADCEYKKIS